MTDTLHRIAQNDTPSAVEVPQTLTGLLVWAAGRFGGGILMAAVCVYGISRIYEDNRATQTQMMQMLQERAVMDANLARTLEGLTAAINQIASDSRDARAKPRP